ncbi:hypothetical protein EHI8A_108250 [Entamoeba histolytica HM-1:IMSS-B]|uniref:Uncharacterized protein n=5 Tax=Entamoeba histolytica TaxID=5759 RepID=C4M082_ENTH1|nr:hypothetical protein EHI_004870 [Entamoeba histolytica HM-1:IMSS]EMH75797.1 hypothetical protein EHI8A_108250 [Entamoeba histolytica HM-1:IMSS-B]EMS16445.1 hypothetical protein KM1_177970 [Entamoeba histolytica HM-3:IMSS]ENY66016.1 hypothetical protein EHI7A_098120 [Entamoeba histolytica HM-1:IMSS-A]GAT94557.1 hypothetical protein CL6EHI_004870 [Entamoeba histolytica]EAL45316.1 hypothetical protein EHI_004870 [Entamoeba histolytica HM-1:IMSS]|eukprot:XP_650703.1 hypothetical protein EHI_004870 [Entamoeba histolytica HM-1:IMSS]
MSKDNKPTQKVNSKFSKEVFLKIKGFIEDSQNKGFLISANSLSCFNEEETSGNIVEIESSDLDTFNVTKKWTTITEKEGTKEDVNTENERLQEAIKGLPNEMVLSLDEFGFQLWKLIHKIPIISLNDNAQSNQWYGREIKMSPSLICINKNREYLTPFLKFPPFEEAKKMITQECFIPKNNNNKVVYYYTKTEFQEWYNKVVVQHAINVRSYLNIDRNVVVIMDEYFKPFVEPLQCPGVFPFFIKTECSDQVNFISGVINSYLNMLKNEYDINENTIEGDIPGFIKEVLNNHLFIYKLLENLEPASSTPIKFINQNTKVNIYNYLTNSKNESEKTMITDSIQKNELITFINQLLLERKCVTLDTIKNYCKIRFQIDVNEEELNEIIKTIGLITKTDFCNVENKDFLLSDVEEFVRGMLYYQEIPVNRTVFIDFFDYRLSAANRMKIVTDKQHLNEAMTISRESVQSSIATALLGDGPLLPLLVGMSPFAKEKNGMALEQSGHIVIPKEYIELSDFKQWVLYIARYVKELYLKKNIHDTSPKQFLIVIPKFFYELIQQIKNELSKLGFVVVFISDNISCVTPLSDMINRVIDNIIRDRTILPGKDILTLDYNFQIAKKVIDVCRIDVIQMVCWPWKYYHDSNQFTLGNIVSEIRKRKECYDFKTLCSPKKLIGADLPCDTFNLMNVPQFYRNSIRLFIGSNKFSNASTKTEQLNLLKGVYQRFGLIPLQTLFEEATNLVVKRSY